jgi:hydroxymethylbilane synthase
MAKHRIIFGTRGSKLALAQTQKVIVHFRRRFPDVQCELKAISTTGDRVQNIALSSMSAQGVFVREIEHELAAGKIDVAVHSLKDLPTRQPEGLVIAAIPERADARDTLYTGPDKSLRILSFGGVVGTSSVRRAAQIRYLLKGVRIEDIRGNVDTRMRKVDGGHYDATILAAAGLLRLELLHKVAYCFAADEMLPAPGQGALALEARADDDKILHYVNQLDCADARATVTAERAVLEALGSGCSLPLAAHAVIRNNHIVLKAAVFNPDGERRLLVKGDDQAKNARKLGEQLAKDLLACGADKILQEIESHATQP